MTSQPLHLAVNFIGGALNLSSIADTQSHWMAVRAKALKLATYKFSVVLGSLLFLIDSPALLGKPLQSCHLIKGNSQCQMIYIRKVLKKYKNSLLHRMTTRPVKWISVKNLKILPLIYKTMLLNLLSVVFTRALAWITNRKF